MNNELEELEKSFIISDDIETDELKSLIDRIRKFCVIDSKGYVSIRRHALTIPQRILLVLSARFLASKLQQKLGRDSSIDELCRTMEIAKILKEKDTVIRVRLKELKDANKVISPGRGIFRIAPHEIEDFLSELENLDE